MTADSIRALVLQDPVTLSTWRPYIDSKERYLRVKVNNVVRKSIPLEFLREVSAGAFRSLKLDMAPPW